MKKFIRIFLKLFLSIGVLLSIGYFIFIHEKPVDQIELNKFLEGQPIIDIHVHITKGYEGNEIYGNGKPEGPELDQIKLDWFKAAFDQHNIVLGLAGGPVEHVKNWINQDSRFWGGPTFPYNELKASSEPFTKEFLSYDELFILYDSLGFKSMGESMYMYFGVHPHDERMDPYWKIAEEFNIPIGVHSAGPPLPWMRDKKTAHLINADYSNPELLRPILKKYLKLKLILYHFCGEYSEESIQLMKDYPNVYCEISAISFIAPKILWEGAVKQLYEEGLGDRLLFGSDFMEAIRGHIEVIYSMDWLTDNQKRDIYYNNAAKMLELSQTEIGHHFQLVKNTHNN